MQPQRDGNDGIPLLSDVMEAFDALDRALRRRAEFVETLFFLHDAELTEALVQAHELDALAAEADAAVRALFAPGPADRGAEAGLAALAVTHAIRERGLDLAQGRPEGEVVTAP